MRYLKTITLRKLQNLQQKSGLFLAAKKGVTTGYDKAWLRDNIYEAMGLEHAGSIDALKKTFAAMFDIFLKHEAKIDLAIANKPQSKNDYIHARYCPITFEEFNEEWGNKQNDAVGAFLFKVGDLYKKGIMTFRDENDLRVLQKLVHYLASIEYWHDADSGMWEENEEVHASSVGACVAGLKAITNIVDVPEALIKHGENTINNLLPRESITKHVDLALLSLIYPYNVVNEKQKRQILRNIEDNLVRNKGVIRYFGDMYYHNGSEAEWCFGFPWLARIYKEIGDNEKFNQYLQLTIKAMNRKNELPELYFGGSVVHNDNTPLGWAHAMLLCALA